MSNRNFDSRVIIQRLRDQNNAQNLYRYQKLGIQSIRNPQVSDSSSERILSYRSGQETTYYNTLSGGYISSIGGVANILAETVPIINNFLPPSDSVPSAPVITTMDQRRTPLGVPREIEIYFTQESDGGSPITNYKYSFDNNYYISLTPEQTSNPLIIIGLSPDTYNITIKAVNIIGDSIMSNQESITIF